MPSLTDPQFNEAKKDCESTQTADILVNKIKDAQNKHQLKIEIYTVVMAVIMLHRNKMELRGRYIFNFIFVICILLLIFS